MSIYTSINTSLGKYLNTVGNINDLRALKLRNLRDGDSIMVSASTALGDLLGGIYIWSEKSLTADDGLSIIRPSNTIGAGRWIRSIASGLPGAPGQGLADVIAPNGSGLVGYKAPVANTLIRTVAAKLADGPVSVMDYMTPAMIADVRKGDGVPTIDCAPAFNAAIIAAQNSGRTVYIPDGYFGIGSTIFFGVQNTAGQSNAPPGFIGASKAGTTLKALPSLTGALLQSWSLAGTTFAHFHINTEGSVAQAWDCRWRPNDPNRSGPSTQCTFFDILVSGTGTLAQRPNQFPVTPHVNMDDMNDSYPTNMTVRVNDPTHKGCSWSFVGSGGLMAMAGCIWTGGYLRWGAQNGHMDHCWGQGIEFAKGCLNTTVITAGYPYDNNTRKAVYWSESYDSYQSVKSLTLLGGQIGTLNADSCYFDMNLYSKIKVIGSEFIGPAKTLLGPNTRTDSFANVIVELDGGKHTGELEVLDRNGVIVIAKNFINDSTGYAVNKDWRGTFTPTLYSGSTVVTQGSGTYARYIRNENVVSFKMRLTWTGAPTTAGQCIVRGLPFLPDPLSIDNVTFQFKTSTFPTTVTATIGGNEISFYSDGAMFNTPTTGDIILSGFYTVKA